MSDLRPLTPLGVRMRDSLPVVLRGSHDYLAVIHAYAKELALLEAAIEAVRAQLNPLTANVLLSAWEAELALPVGGGGAPDSTRIAAITARLHKVTGQSEGREWIAAITEIVGAGWTYEEHNPADGGSPPEGVIRVTVPFASGTPFFIESENQVRELTPAHLELDFIAGGAFALDSSDMDISEFGA